MFIRVPVFFNLIITLTLVSSVVLGQDGYESPVLDDDESFTQAFQKRINDSGTAASQPVQQSPVQQTAPAKQPAAPTQNRGGLFERPQSANQQNGKINYSAPAKQPAPATQNRGGLLERPQSANQQKGKNNTSAPAANSAENDKAAKSSWWQFWKKKEKNPEPETAPSDSVTPQQSIPQAPSNAPRYDQPAPPAYQNSGSGNSAVNPPVSSTAQYEAPRANGQGFTSNPAPYGAANVQSGSNHVGTHIQTATGTEMKPTAQADVQVPQYDWSQSRMDSMRAGNLPGQRPFLTYDGAKIVAKVENAVILESDVQAGIKKRIAKMQREAKKNGAEPLTENDLQREIQMWQVQVLQELIQHHVMFTKACSSIPRENLENVKAAVDKAFDDKQLPVMIKEYGVASQWELEQALKAEGSCIEKEKQKFFEQSVGFQWLQMQAEPAKEIRHDQIMDYYKEHIDKYTVTPKARWEELVVFKYQFSSREEAYKAIQKMGQAVVAGKPFAEVAKQSSQGVTASDGGKRDWVSPDALNSEPLNKALFEQPVGDLSPRIIEDENCFYIVRVLERHGKKMIPFEEAQTEIRKKLTEEQEEENRKKAFEKVFKEAKVTISGAEQPDEELE